MGLRSFFTPEGEEALMFMKMYTGLGCPKLLEQLNGNIHYQIFCDVIIDPIRLLTNYKLLDDIMMELADTTASGHTRRQVETVHGESGHDVHRCYVL